MNSNEQKYFDDDTIVLLTNIIRKIIKDELDSAFKSRNIESFMDLKVDSVSNDNLTATLIDMVSDEKYIDIPNHTNVKLSPGDVVRMYTTNQTYNNQYIGMTFGNRTNLIGQER